MGGPTWLAGIFAAATGAAGGASATGGGVAASFTSVVFEVAGKFAPGAGAVAGL